MPIYTKVADDGGKWVEIGANESVEPGLPGLGGWATITEVTGVYTPHRYNDGPGGVGGTDWVVYEFTDDGTLTTQVGGLVDAFFVSGGSGNPPNTLTQNGGGGGGSVLSGIELLPDGELDVVIGAGGVGNTSDWENSMGRASSIGTLATPMGFAYANQGAGATPANRRLPIASSITGTSQTYAAGESGNATPSTTTFGDGFNPNGKRGVVIVRVPKAYADGVAENFHGWESFALVNDGVVTDVTKVPENEPHTLDAEWLPCDADVQPGWDHTDGEFTPPPAPTRDDLIAELKDRIKDLQKDK